MTLRKKKIFFYLSLVLYFFFFGNITLKYIWYSSAIVFELPKEIIYKSGKETTLWITRKYLTSSDKEKNVQGLKILKDLKDPEMIPLVFKYIHNEDRILSAKALETLQSMISPAMYDSLIKIASKSDDRTRLGILQTIASSINNNEVDILSDYQQDNSWIIRMTLADELRKYKTEKSYEILEKLINDNVFEVAYTAAVALSESGKNNPFADIFLHLLPNTSWQEKFKSILLISLYPNKLVNLLIASFIESDYKFLQVAALEWMSEKGDERDFSYIIKKSKKINNLIVKNCSYKTLAKLAGKTGKQDQLILNFMRFLENSRHEQRPALIKALGILNAKVAESEILKYKNDEDLDLAAVVIETFGKLSPEKNMLDNIALLKSPHDTLRTAYYKSLLNVNRLNKDIIKSTFKKPKTTEEAESLALVITKFFPQNRAKELLKEKYKNSKTRNIKMVFLEYLAASDPSISSLTLLKQLDKKDISSWHKVKNISSRSRIEIIPAAIVAGFRFYRSRIPEKTLYSVMSFTSSSGSFWNHKDILYLKGKNKGKIEGTLLYKDYNSYYFSTNEDEVVQIEKRLVKKIILSPLNQMKKLREDLRFNKKLLNNSLNSENWELAGYIIHKSLMILEIMHSEIQHFLVARQCMDQEIIEWRNIHKEFTQKLENNKLLKVHGHYTTINELKADELQKLDPEEANKLQKEADEIFNSAANFVADRDWEKAIEKYHQALSIWPYHQKSIREIGTALVRLDRFQEALDFYNKLLKKRPDDPDIYNSISLIFRIKEDYTEALDYLTQEIELNPSSQRARIGAAEVLIELGREEEGIELLENGIELIDTPYDIHYMLTKIYRKSNQIDDALHHINKCIEIKRDDVNSYIYKAILLFSAGKIDDSVSILKKSLTIDMGNIAARMTLVDIYLSAGEKKLAKEELIKVLAIDPSNREAKEILDSL